MSFEGQYPDSVGKIKTRYGMTTQQRALLTFLRQYSDANGGVMPTFEEMMWHLGLASKSGIHRILVALEARGHITRGRGARQIALTARDGGPIQDAIRRVLAECQLSSVTRLELSAKLRGAQ